MKCPMSMRQNCRHPLFLVTPLRSRSTPPSTSRLKFLAMFDDIEKNVMQLLHSMFSPSARVAASLAAPSSLPRSAPEPLRRFWRATLTWPSEKKQSSGAAPQRDIISYGWRALRELSANRSEHWQLIRASAEKTASPLWQPISASDSALSLLDVRCRVMVLPVLSVIVSSEPLALLDLAGGCCRKEAPLALRALPTSPGRLLGAARGAVEHPWLFLASHSHSATFYHALGEAAPKLMCAVRFLRANPEISVLHNSPHIADFMEVLKLRNRAVVQTDAEPVFARRLLVPPGEEPLMRPSLLRAVRAETFANLGIASSAAPAARDRRRPRRVIVVRRSAVQGKTTGGRALLNHDELMLLLRHVLLPKSVELEEFGPRPMKLGEAAALWSRADVVIAPHGAGTTNALFMPPNSTVIELLAVGQRGRVYQGLSKVMEHKYVLCEYTRGGHGSAPLSLPSSLQRGRPLRLDAENAGFSINLTHFMECFERAALPLRR